MILYGIHKHRNRRGNLVDNSSDSYGDVFAKKIPQPLQCCKSRRYELLLGNPSRNEMGGKKKQQMGNLLNNRKRKKLMLKLCQAQV